MGEFNREMLILAREFIGITQSELAARVGLSQAEISKIESGVRTPSEEQVGVFARHLNCVAEFFYVSDSIKNFRSADKHQQGIVDNGQHNGQPDKPGLVGLGGKQPEIEHERDLEGRGDAVNDSD